MCHAWPDFFQDRILNSDLETADVLFSSDVCLFVCPWTRIAGVFGLVTGKN